MSIAAIRTALFKALDAMSPALATAYPNITYTPVAGTAYQKADVLLARPDDSEIGPGAKPVDQGFLEVSLRYPINKGPDAIDARADLLRAAFAAGATFVSGSTTVLITKTPEVTPAQTIEDRYIVPVRIYFQAQVSG